MIYNYINTHERITAKPENIDVNYINGDYAIHNVAWTLLAPRVPEEDLWKIASHKFRLPTPTDSNDTVQQVVDFLKGGNYVLTSNWKGITLLEFNFSDDNMIAPETIRKFETFILSHPDLQGYVKHQDLTDFLSQIMSSAVYLDTAKQRALVVTFRFEMTLVHCIAASLPALIPAPFLTKKLTTEESRLLMSLTENMTCYENAMNDVFSGEVYYPYDLRRKMKDFGKAIREHELIRIRQDIDYAETVRKDAIRTYQNQGRKLACLNNEYNGLLAAPKIDDSELIAFLQNNKSVELISRTSDGIMTIRVRNKIDNYDPDMYDTYACSDDWRQEVMECLYDEETPEDDMWLLMDDLFSDSPHFAIRVQAVYVLMPYGSCHVDRDYANVKTYMRNPHIARHACLGDYQLAIDESLDKHDYVTAITQCIMSARSLNISETGPTFAPFMGELFDSRDKVLQDNEGNLFTVPDAIQWLKNRNL